MNEPKIIVALDYSSAQQAKQMLDRLSPELCGVKVGKELFVSAGPDFVRYAVAQGFNVFLDLKFHDIPNTIKQACLAAAELGVWMVNVHASGGINMMQTAREALDSFSGPKPLLIGVTVLTSLDQQDLQEVGIALTPQQQVMHLAKLTQQAGLDGIVCSAQEASALRQHCGTDFKLVTPGIRLAQAQQDDQKRIVTPQKAINDGADYLVIGRPVTQAEEPISVLKTIVSSICESKAKPM